MKELEQWGYIKYAPSSNLHSGSRVACIRFDTATYTGRDTGNSTGIENDTGTDTASGTGTFSSIESDTGRNTGRVASTSCSTESDTATDTARDTGNSTGIENDTGTDTAGDTGTSSGIESDTARNTASDTGEVTGITAGIKSDTASDTLFINVINKNKPYKERGEIFDFSNEKKKAENKPPKENSENIDEENFQPPNFLEVEIFFRKNNYSISESQKFYNHYQSNGWKLGGKMKIVDWQAAARKWMINAKKFENNERGPNQIRTGKLSVNTNKDYSEPL
ncbi:MAG: hypothetical protein JJE55_15875 [Flavobacteriaceae bacterium]|nr:hypothetical protein [Flavobacteriaceae bacterium]